MDARALPIARPRARKQEACQPSRARARTRDARIVPTRWHTSCYAKHESCQSSVKSALSLCQIALCATKYPGAPPSVSGDIPTIQTKFLQNFLDKAKSAWYTPHRGGLPPFMPNKTVRSIVLENALSQTPLRPRDLARTLGLNLDTIYRETARLRKQNLLPPPPHKATRADRKRAAIAVSSPPLGASEKHTVWVQKDVEDIVNSEVMPELERLQKLSDMARFGPDAISIAAIKALEELGRARGNTVGPGKPLTEDEQVARLARLCIAVGREITERALKTAFPEENVELPQETSEEHPRVAPSDSGVGGLPA